MTEDALFPETGYADLFLVPREIRGIRAAALYCESWDDMQEVMTWEQLAVAPKMALCVACVDPGYSDLWEVWDGPWGEGFDIKPPVGIKGEYSEGGSAHRHNGINEDMGVV